MFGARVYRAAEKETGWFPVRRSTTEGLAADLPEEFTPLQWHGETFDLPAGAVRLAETTAVPNQGFQIGRGVIGLQLHVEATVASVQQLVENAAQEIEVGKPFHQSAETIVRMAALRSEKAAQTGHRLRTKIYVAWLDTTLRLEAKGRKLDLEPTAEGIRANFVEPNGEVSHKSVALNGDPGELLRDWLG